MRKASKENKRAVSEAYKAYDNLCRRYEKHDESVTEGDVTDAYLKYLSIHNAYLAPEGYLAMKQYPLTPRRSRSSGIGKSVVRSFFSAIVFRKEVRSS